MNRNGRRCSRPARGLGPKVLNFLLAAAVTFASAAAGWVSPALAAESGDKIFMGYWAKWGGDPDPMTSLDANISRIDFFSPYWFTLRADGTVSSRETGHDALRTHVQGAGRKVLPLINKVSDDTPLLNSWVRTRAVENIHRLLVEGGYDGVNIDFEGMPPSTRAGLTAFMRELSARLRSAGLLVTMAVPAKWSADDSINSFAACFDYAALGEVVDYLVIMTYDQHGPWSGPGPVAGADWVKRVIEYAVTVVPREKILLGLAGYGYDWSYAGCRSIKAADAPGLAARHGATIRWDSTAQVPYFVYYSSGLRHQVWYENSYSVDFKVDMVNRYGLGGVALWSLGQEDARFWEVIAGKAGFSGGLGRTPRTAGTAGTADSRSSPFEDVPSDHWAYEAVARLWAEGAIKGARGAGGGADAPSYEPERPITRAEFATLITRAFELGPPPTGAPSPSFIDVTESDWFHDAVTRAVAAGYMLGRAEGFFEPLEDLTRQEAALVAARVKADLPSPPDTPVPDFTDSSRIAAWALAAVLEAAQKGLLNGYPDGTFRPASPLRRAEAAVLVDRLNP
jgi:hypothetical protein